jgi:hypothetical protein
MLKLSASMVKKMMEVDGSLNFFRVALVESMSFVKPVMTDEEFNAFITEILDEVNIPKKMTAIYQEYYSADDVLNLIAFFKSTTGKKVLNVSNKLIPKININTQLIAAELMVVALKKLSDKDDPKPPDQPPESQDLT